MRKNIILKNKKMNRDEICCVRLMDFDEIDLVIKLQDIVYELLPNKNVFYKDSKSTLGKNFVAGGVILGIFNQEDELIAYRNTSVPRNSLDNLGLDILLDDNELLDVIHLESTIVHPDFRGNGLQMLTFEILSEIKNLKDKHLLCTVSPENTVSLHNMMSLGFIIKEIKFKYTVGEKKLLRFILYKGPKENFKSLHEQAGRLSVNFESNDMYSGQACEIADIEGKGSFYSESLIISLDDTNGHFEVTEDDFKGVIFNRDKNYIVYIKNQPLF